MRKITSYEKLSKKGKRALAAKARSVWIRSPVTRCPPKPGAYDRNKARRESLQQIHSELSSSHTCLEIRRSIP